ncbi:metallophosphoesterase [Rhodococcus sp. NPDC058505]|uniref:metallophosphoesterase n=1 Tax=unclassified Rhodococcus (in: high G+C Gram-positive bacteria) TaxID=192944 RepID=UPI00365440CE
MLRILLFAVLLALLSWWLYRRMTRLLELSSVGRRVLGWGLGLLGAAALIGVGSGEVFDPAWARGPAVVGWVWLAAGLYLTLGLGILTVLAALARRVRRGPRRATDRPAPPGPGNPLPPGPADPTRRRLLRGAAAAVVLASVGAVGYGVAEAAAPRIVRVRVPLRRLPAEFAGTRIALVTDLHVGPARGAAFTRRVVAAVGAERPDLILLGGDLVDGTVAKVGADLAPLADLDAPLGVFGVSGNHEFYAGDGGRWLDLWERLGIHTLRNTRVELRRGDAVIDLAGVHDYRSPAPYEPDLPAALAGRDRDRAVILLAHQPKQVTEAAEWGVDLQLSGHTHGGQMWPLGYVVPLQQPSVTGLDRFGDTVLYTSRGAGAWGPPVRVGAPPEITILELTR